MPNKKKIETCPDAWDRFEHAVDAAVKSGPKPKEPKAPPAKRSSTMKQEKRRSEGRSAS